MGKLLTRDRTQCCVLTSCLCGDPVVLEIDRIHLLKWSGRVFASRMTNLLRRALNKEDEYNKQFTHLIICGNNE